MRVPIHWPITFFLLMSGPILRAEDDSRPVESSPVGVAARLEQVVLPGSELEAIPQEDPRTPLMLRIVDAYPHGSDTRYDLEFYGLEPGTYDLRDFLRRKDGTDMAGLPSLPVEIVSQLPQGHILPHELEHRRAPSVGGYRMWLIAGTILWIAGLAAILLIGRQRKTTEASKSEKPVSVVDCLRPLLDRALQGQLTIEEQAELERLLVDYWRHRLQLDDSDPIEALATIRQHAEAGELLRNVERWLHSPEGVGEVDIAAVLSPYRGLPENRETLLPAEAKV